MAFDCDGAQEAKILLNGERKAYKINLRTGESEALEYFYEDGKTVIKKTFVKGEELLIAIDEMTETLLETADKTEIEVAEKEVFYQLNEPNILPLDYAEYTIDGENQGSDEFLKIDKKIRKKFNFKERSANNRQPWFE